MLPLQTDSPTSMIAEIQGALKSRRRVRAEFSSFGFPEFMAHSVNGEQMKGFELAPVRSNGRACEACPDENHARKLVKDAGGAFFWTFYGIEGDGCVRAILDGTLEEALAEAVRAFPQIAPILHLEP